MMRQVKFEASTRQHFEWLHRGIILGAAMQSKQERTAEVMRRDRSILRKMKLISREMVDKDGKPEIMSQTGERVRDMGPIEEGLSIVLELSQPELDQLNKYIENVPWLATNTEPAFDTLDFLNASERVEK